MILEERFGNKDLGGASPESWDICLLSLSGDAGMEPGRCPLNEEGSLGLGSRSDDFSSTTPSAMASKSDGDCSRLAP